MFFSQNVDFDIEVLVDVNAENAWISTTNLLKNWDMSSSASLSFPLTVSPVFDAKNRWAALYIALGESGRLEKDFFSLLCDDAEDISAEKLPLLIELDDFGQLGDNDLEVPPDHPLYLLFPASTLAAQHSHDYLRPLTSRGIRVMSRGMPPSGLGNSVESLVTECHDDASGDANALLSRLPGPHLASKVDSYALHRKCLSAGYRWFKGDWALYPENDKEARTSTSRSTLLNLLTLVVNDADSRELETLLKRDTNLSYQLLKLVNSVSFSLTHKISSFNQAITLLGRRQLQRWLQLLLYAGQHAEGAAALLGIAAMRAGLMEALAQTRGCGQEEQDHAYMVGMFSLLDILFKAPLDILLAPLNLHQDILQALLAGDGILGKLLGVAIASNGAPSNAMAAQLAELDISSAAFVAAQLRANAWAAQVCREV